MEEENRLS